MSILQQTLGGVSQVWVQLALLVSLTVVIVWRREAVVSVTAYRRAFTLMAMTVMVPAILTCLMPLIAANFTDPAANNTFRRGSNPLQQMMSGGMQYVYPIMQSIGPILLGMAILSLSRAIVPKFIPPVGPPGTNSSPTPPASSDPTA